MTTPNTLTEMMVGNYKESEERAMLHVGSNEPVVLICLAKAVNYVRAAECQNLPLRAYILFD